MKQILGPELFVSLLLVIFVLIISALFKKNILNSEKIQTDPDLQKQDSSKTELTAPENEVNLSATPNNEAKQNDAIQIYEQNYEKLKTEFLATLRHELKTPLVSIIGYLDLIATEKLGVITDRQTCSGRFFEKNRAFEYSDFFNSEFCTYGSRKA